MNKFTVIREQVFSILNNRLTDCNVYKSRIFNLPNLTKNAVSIYVTGEVGEYTESQEDVIRRASVNLQYYVKGKDAIETEKNLETSIDEKLESLINEAEALLIKQYQTLNKNVYWLRYQSIDIQRYNEGEEFILVANQVWEARYHDSSPSANS